MSLAKLLNFCLQSSFRLPINITLFFIGIVIPQQLHFIAVFYLFINSTKNAWLFVFQFQKVSSLGQLQTYIFGRGTGIKMLFQKRLKVSELKRNWNSCYFTNCLPLFLIIWIRKLTNDFHFLFRVVYFKILKGRFLLRYCLRSIAWEDLSDFFFWHFNCS